MSKDATQALKEPTVDVVTAGQLLGVGRSTAYKLARNGGLPAVRVGAQYRVSSARLREMLGLPPNDPTPQAPIAA